MKPTRMILTLAATAACALGAASTASAARADVQQASSENWSGYVAGGSSSSSAARFKSVSGSWVAPTAKCTSSAGGSGATYAAFWVGLGGAGQTQALEQAGTETNCGASGQPTYYAWYELVPAAPVRINLAVHPGDHISTRVTVEGTAVDVSVSNQTTDQSFSKQLTMNNPDVSSAEWIAEVPSACDGSGSCTPLPLTNFGTVNFNAASATTSDGQAGSISDSNWSTAAVSLTPGAGSSGFQGVDLASGQSSGSAVPSSLSSGGSSFSVAYSASGTGTGASTSTSTGGQGYGGGGGYGSGDGYGYGSGDGYGYGGGSPGYGDGGYGDGGGYGYGGAGYGYGYGAGGRSDGGYGYGAYVG